MNKRKNTYLTIGSIVVAIGLIAFALYYSKCHGDECDAKISRKGNDQKEEVKKEVQEVEELFPKMIPSVIKEQILNNEVVLVDVREDSEWAEGHMMGAKHIALGNINIETTRDLPHDKQIYVYCRSGKRAGEAEIKLKSLGFGNAENLGGIIYWQGRGGELVK